MDHCDINVIIMYVCVYVHMIISYILFVITVASSRSVEFMLHMQCSKKIYTVKYMLVYICLCYKHE